MAYDRKTYDIFISDELKTVLTEIESESIVASLLLKKRHFKDELVDDPINFISISRDDNSKISYLTTERIGQIDNSEYWTSSKRFQVKPGGFVSKIFKNIPAKEVEKFSNLYRSEVKKPDFIFKIVSGDKIKDYYHYSSYASDKGTLGNSCMKHDSCQKYLDIYTDNDHIVSMLIMTNFWGELLGRALLWNFESYKIMDRIYTICDEDLSFYFKKWATKNGYLYKTDQNWFNTLQFEQVGQKKQELKLEVQLKNHNYRHYPYMDTFKFLNPHTGILTNYMPSNFFETLCSSDGSKYEKDYLIFDDIDRVLRYRQEVVYIRYRKIWTHERNSNWSEVNDCHILAKDSIYNEKIDDFIFIGDFENLNNVDMIKQRILDRENQKDIVSKIQEMETYSIESILDRLRQGNLI